MSAAINDLTKAIALEKNFVDAYWQRHLVYLTQNKKNEAIQDLTILLKINRTHAGAYISMYVWLNFECVFQVVHKKILFFFK